MQLWQISCWLSNSKKRYNLRSTKKEAFRLTIFLNSVTNYQLEDIYNCDETALYWQLLPSKSIATGPSSGIKKSKQRITILLTVKATGSHKLKLLIINNNKWQTPRSLKHIDKTSLPVYYFWNKNAWMQRSIFEIYLKNLNNMMQQSGRHILLLTDNASCHSIDIIDSLSNVKVHFLPPNTTSHLQPMDAGIIYSFKVRY